MMETPLELFARLFPDSGAPRTMRAPGRVNLIGEHTDYNGLPVLPMAITRGVRALFSPRGDGRICLRNLDPAFPDTAFMNAADIAPSAPGAWDNYVKAAVLGVRGMFPDAPTAGMNLLVGSDLPAGAGLSSSSALVVASAMALLDTLGRAPETLEERTRLASVLAEAEHFVGTRGGGMDQAVILLGEAGHACKIDFFPLRAARAPLPEDCAVVVCDSMVKAEKSGAARARYNLNPRLCALACALTRAQLREDFGEDVPLERLGDLWHGPLCLTTREAEALFARAVPAPRATVDDAARRLRMTPDEVRARWLDGLPEPEGGFDLAARLRHQAGEHRRVEHARDALLANDPESFGRLMAASHESCRDNLQVSCPELDMLVEDALAEGALGARLTGAGFGGATVNLVWRNRAEDFIEAMARRHYRDRRGHTGPAPAFIAEAGPGARIEC